MGEQEYKNSDLNSDYIDIARKKNSINTALYRQRKAKLRKHDLQFFPHFCNCLILLGPLWDVLISLGALTGEGNKAREFQE